MNTKQAIAIVFVLLCLAVLQAAQVAPDERIKVPLSYRDPDSGIILVVESDRHHIVAVDKNGKVLWCRQPATEGNLPPYSESNPKPNPAIVWIGALTVTPGDALQKTGSGKMVGISFNSRQAGALDLKTGDFTFQGQD